MRSVSEGRVASWAQEGAYRGPDRRRRTVGVCAAVPLGAALGVTGLVCVGAGLPVIFSVTQRTSSSMASSYLAVASGLLAVVAGTTSLVSWKILGRALLGWLGVSLVVLGVLRLAQSLMGSFGIGPAPEAQAFDQLASALIAGGLLWRGVTDDEVNSAFPPFTALIVGVGGGVGALALLNLVQSLGLVPSWAAGSAGHAASDGLTAAVWLGVAAATGWASVRRRCSPTWTMLVPGLLGIAPLVRLAAPFGSSELLASSVFTFAATALALGAATARIQTLLQSEDGQKLRLHRTLRATQRLAESEQEQLEEWLHDLRNAVAGLRAADEVLRARSEPDLAARASLADAVTAEIGRLQVLVDPSRAMRREDVVLSEALAPTIAAERSTGTPIDVHVGDLCVRADRDALARVVQNVLANARRYAPATRVVVSAHRHGGDTEVSVRDGGPGIAAEERLAVFGRGHRGAASSGTEGSGLGLYMARSLMGTMGGDIRIAADGQPGCCVVLTLPAVAASTGAPVDGDRQRSRPDPVPGDELRAVS